MKHIGIAIAGSGSATPSSKLSNHGLSDIVETSDEWIRTRTGIGHRRLSAPGESLTQIATQAGVQALEMAGVAPTDLDLIILATSTPDDLFGSASQVQAALGATQAAAFDLTAACSGFLFALVTASQYIRSGAYQKILVIGADLLSRWVDWSDRTTCVLFGDGAGAAVIEATSQADNLLGFQLNSDGSLNHCLRLAARTEAQELCSDVSIAQGNYAFISMNGKEVYRFAVQKVPEALEKNILQANLTSDDIDWLVLHQANQRILDAVAKRLNIPSEKVLSNLANYGNTSAASIPLVLDEAVRAGKIKPGDLIAASGFGAGLTWGSAIFRWGR
ncbi:beta-ketoacyl-ACP synthase III [Roseofilum casamattae]|uniref:Beta-ketoacyl-[acyl-carrier-protein] synthase III n=1 Tax=Roseofilum casamattae BLCC-M143 TaxID=3022442 RepID=A0ABT7BSW7_9CYAN|nr:ketoacyl-ACP synthase III [Roseofilum casamattae BLCC-M143]